MVTLEWRRPKHAACLEPQSGDIVFFTSVKVSSSKHIGINHLHRKNQFLPFHVRLLYSRAHNPKEATPCLNLISDLTFSVTPLNCVTQERSLRSVLSCSLLVRCWWLTVPAFALTTAIMMINNDRHPSFEFGQQA